MTNCVGFHNQKYFVLFMGYGIVGLTFELLCVIVRVYQLFAAHADLVKLTLGTVMSIAMDGILSFALSLALSMLCSYQMWCLMRNTSTIEHYDYSRRKRFAKRNGVVRLRFVSCCFVPCPVLTDKFCRSLFILSIMDGAPTSRLCLGAP